ncbi:MFS transporter [Kutzneria kofuensis]|uniref:Putative MFS family arabinose efflux permease n=1 Tax=Kutzneria kofuensis TaxID=103725 RepID=A0A7W9KEG4_9PSEU|nr:MFS transporter [Kutzneria kofuensis]MBB5891041.1 putative MFS family arabinose efflux permease [Kutzneria kofuensis]
MLTRRLTAVLAATCAVTSSNIYLIQPVLGQVAADLRIGEGTAGIVPTATQLGYAAGILLLVPLGDIRNRRPLILSMMAATTLALAGAALAPSVGWLAAAGFAIGLLTPIPQVVLPLGVALAGGERSGHVVGILQGGLLVGLLASRAYAGAIGQVLGWRQVYWCSVAMMVIVGLVLVRTLPSAPPHSSMSYPAVVRSLPRLLLGNRIVLGVCAAGVVVGAAFGTFWNTLSFVLLHEFDLGPAIVGLFGLVAAASALTSPLAGRLTDRFGPRLGQFTLVGLVLLAWVALAVGPQWIGWFVIGTVLLDVGVWGNQVVNQAVLFGLDSAHHNRLNTLYFFTRFLGIAAGSAFGAQLWDAWGWSAVAALGLLASAVGLPAAVLAAPRSERQHAG